MRHLLTVCTLLLATGAGIAACVPESGGDDATPPEAATLLVGYLYGGTLDDLRRVDAARLTHLNYAFANLTADGDVRLERPDDAERIAVLVGLKAKNPDLRILLSVGGWTWSDHFSDVALGPASRERFARNAVALMRRHELDGLDIDWEYPGQAGEGNVFRPEDRTTFTLLMQALRRHLDAQTATDERAGRPYLLTIAAAAGANYLAHTEMAEVQQHLDFINLMTYDFYGPWSQQTGHHAALHPSAAMPGAPSTSATVQRFLAAGVPPQKIVVGAAFYGYGWSEVEGAEGGFGQPYAGTAESIRYTHLLALLEPASGYVAQWDSTAQAATLWNPTTRRFISYESPDALRAKAAYVRAEGLGGVMYWQHTSDTTQALLHTIHDALY